MKTPPPTSETPRLQATPEDAPGSTHAETAPADSLLSHQGDQRLSLLEDCLSRLNDIVLITEAEPVDEPGPRILYVNDAFVRRTGYTREEVLGRSPRFLQGKNTQRDVLDRIRAALLAFRPVREEIINYTKSGEEFWLEIDIVPVADAQGRHTHCVAIERDITERKRAEAARHTRDQDNQKQHAALAALTHSELLLSGDESAALHEITSTLARTLGAERTSLWCYNPEHTAIICQDLYEATPDQHSKGQELRAEAFPSYLRALAECDVISAGDARQDERTREFTHSYLEPLGITSMLDVPVLVAGSLSGVLCIEHVGPPRQWTHGEQSFAISAANLVSLTLSHRAHARSESRLRSILKSEPECVKIVSLEGLLIDMNPAGLRMLEVDDLQQVLGCPVSSLVHPEDQAAFLDLHHRVCLGQTGQLEFRMSGLRGTPLWLETHSTPLRETDGTISSVLSVTRDVTTRKQDEQKRLQVESVLRASEATMAVAQHISHFGSWELDLTIPGDVTANTLRWSDEMCRIVGYQPGTVTVTNQLFFDHAHPDDHAAIRQAVAEAIRERRQYSISHRLIRADGVERIVHETARIFFDDQTGRPLKMVGTTHDITEQRKSEETLREQAALLDKAQDAILVRDLDNHIRYWNQSAERLYGWTAQEALGRSILGLLYQDPTAMLAATEIVRTQGEWVGEIEQRARDGRPLVVEGRWTLVRDDQGRPKTILAINTDITQRKKLEQQFLRSQRMESVGTLAGGIAHDLNNVLTPIMMAIELLKMEETHPQRLSILNTIESSARRGADMVRQVLSFARGVEGQKLEVRLCRLMHEIEDIIRETFQKNIHIITEIPAGLWVVDGDSTQLHQVILNLCVNARDAMPEGGTLTLSASNEVLDASFVGLNLDSKVGPHVAIQVEDSGSGMTQEIINRIFDPFFTTKELGKGTGLGLSTSQAIIKSHGGFIRVYSEVGRGSKFWIYLPARTDAAAHPTDDPQADVPAGKGELILVVDDEEAVRQITRHILETFGYRVMLAADGAEATALYATHQQDIAVVLTDMMMPAMDGAATIKALLHLNPHVRIIAASGLSANGMVAKATAAGIRHFLPKPYTSTTLLKALQDILHQDSEDGRDW
jgi:PAS domain S-box-containing protein